MDLPSIGKYLIKFGGIIIAAGILFVIFGKVPFLGRLPGDILVQRKNFTLFFPVATSILISLILSLIFWLWSKH